MLAECVKPFLDLDAGAFREAGDRFEVSPDRLEAINATRYGTLAVEVPEAPSEASETPSEVSGGADAGRGPKRAARKAPKE